MSLVNPILGALAAAFIALPIILHFLRRKRKPVQWGAMRFLIEAYRRKRRRMTLEQILLLLSRCALVALFALAIARPLFGASSARTGPTELYILLDDSIASATLDDTGQETFERLRAQAVALLDTLAPDAGDRAGLILASTPVSAQVLPASGDIAAVRRAVERATRTDARADLTASLQLLEQSLSTDEDNPPAVTIALLSTLREGAADPERPLPRLDTLGRRVRVIASAPDTAAKSNTAIASIEPVRTLVLGQSERDGQALIRLERSGAGVGQAARAAVTLGLEGSTSTGRAEARFQPGQTSAEVMLGFVLPESEAATQPILTARLEPDDNRADDISLLPIDRRTVLRVGIVASRPLVGQVGLDRFTPADWVRLALAPAEASGELRLVDTTPSSLDAPRLATLDAAVILEPDGVPSESWPLLRRFVERGGLVLLMPPAKDSVQLWTDAMTEALGLDWQIAREPLTTEQPLTIDTQSRPGTDRLLTLIAGELDALAASVTFQKLLPLLPDQTDESVVLRLTDGSVLLAAAHPVTPSGRFMPGLVIYLASPPSLAWTDLPTRPLMVPLMQELVRQGVGLASDRPVRTAGLTGALPGRATEVADAAGQPVDLPIRAAGRYTLTDDAGESAGILAVLPDIAGSRIGTIPPQLLEPWLAAAVGSPDNLSWIDAQGATSAAELAQHTSDSDSASSTWALWLLAAVLALAVIETALARWSARSMERLPAAEIAQ